MNVVVTLSLPQVLSLDDPVQFEAVPQDSSDNPHLCSWFAQVIWKGRRPFEVETVNNHQHSVATVGRRGSVGSTGETLDMVSFSSLYFSSYLMQTAVRVSPLKARLNL